GNAGLTQGLAPSDGAPALTLCREQTPSSRVFTTNSPQCFPADPAACYASCSRKWPIRSALMKLYFAPGACSMAPHIVLREAGYTFDLEKVELAKKQTASGEDYTQINPKGYVPALRLGNGEVLTEAAVTLQYLADQKPESGLAPKTG